MDQLEQIKSESAAREQIVLVARSWVGTPYFPRQQKKNVGCDCGSFLAAVFSEAGLISPVELGDYDWTEAWARDGGDEYYNSMLERFAHLIEERVLAAGDVVQYRVGRGWSHSAIIARWPGDVIHALRRVGVVATPGNTGFLAGRQRRFWSVFGDK
jgi:cell wall-associated NlpC family hydrolase